MDAGEVKAFAEKIKTAVAAKDIEALADLTESVEGRLAISGINYES